MHVTEPNNEAAQADLGQLLEQVSRSEQRRLLAIASYFSGRAMMSPEDLLQESIFRILNGDRNVPADLEIVRFIAGVMKSIASGEVGKRKRRLEVGFSETPCDIDLFAATHSDERPNTEDEIVYKETTTASDRAFTAWLEETFEGDEKTLLVLYAMFEGHKGQSLCAAADVSMAELATIRRRIRRKMNEFKGGSDR